MVDLGTLPERDIDGAVRECRMLIDADVAFDQFKTRAGGRTHDERRMGGVVRGRCGRDLQDFDAARRLRGGADGERVGGERDGQRAEALVDVVRGECRIERRARADRDAGVGAWRGRQGRRKQAVDDDIAGKARQRRGQQRARALDRRRRERERRCEPHGFQCPQVRVMPVLVAIDRQAMGERGAERGFARRARDDGRRQRFGDGRVVRCEARGGAHAALASSTQS